MSRLPPDARVIYLGYAFEGVCAGAPYWITMRDAVGSVVCNDSGLLATLDGTGEVACYHEDGTLPEGTYTVTLTLMDEAPEVLGFAVEVEPHPFPVTPRQGQPHDRSYVLRFSPPRALRLAARLRPLTLFDWYTQVVYAGGALDLLPQTTWRSTWWHEGEMLRQATGMWHGPSRRRDLGQPDGPGRQSFSEVGSLHRHVGDRRRATRCGLPASMHEPQVGSQVSPWTGLRMGRQAPMSWRSSVSPRLSSR